VKTCCASQQLFAKKFDFFKSFGKMPPMKFAKNLGGQMMEMGMRSRRGFYFS